MERTNANIEFVARTLLAMPAAGSDETGVAAEAVAEDDRDAINEEMEEDIAALGAASDVADGAAAGVLSGVGDGELSGLVVAGAGAGVGVVVSAGGGDGASDEAGAGAGAGAADEEGAADTAAGVLAAADRDCCEQYLKPIAMASTLVSTPPSAGCLSVQEWMLAIALEKSPSDSQSLACFPMLWKIPQALSQTA